jgi:F0F1-type ATP synthase epsilon subunit
MAEATLRFRVRTPQGIAFEAALRSLRVPTDTGQVGLRPRAERTALGVEPGLVLAAAPDRLCFVASAGGLLRCEGNEAVLLTPLAVVGDSAPAVRAALEAALRGAQADLELRRVLQRLETGLLHELRRAAPASGP